MEELSGRVAVVTGAASGIGRGMIDAFAAEGMKLVLADIEAEPLERAVSELRAAGAEAAGVECDVSDPGSVEALRDEALRAFGKVHVLCNNAGVAGSGGVASWELPQEEWDWVLGVNLNGVIYGQRSFVPAMIEQGEGGHVVNTSSMAGLVPGMGPYGVSKHAVVALSASLHRELATRELDIGVSVLCPGWVRTRIMESDRNRPEAPRVDPGEAAPLIEMLRNAVAGLVEKGHDPLDVGRLVVDAIKRRRFYVLTHPAWKNMIRHRVENILEDREPTSVTPDGDPAGWSELLERSPE